MSIGKKPTRIALFVKVLLVFSLTTVLSACATADLSRCETGQKAMLSSLLYFGTAKPGGTVTAEEWQSFVNDTITPRFPEGFTAWSASGQWRSADGVIAREAAFVVNVVHAASIDNRSALDGISAAYKARFQQESVLRSQTATCVSF